ncbi:hybrid sensor histidine kinase/response regulator [Chitinivibrio alkaliphilus]|uniref:histidine kinase n=1 Tax=Chitinivibrio alkaliphilus ACht1 TaxID=1313304 RepID=U7D9I5_9BACT|nr:response regulator [Chitinivibrio alkaliphilus]ERP39054.1 PAS/PAC sensor hybrid histidine kinase [Chitinivibrio alkaliphilus ACht1]
MASRHNWNTMRQGIIGFGERSNRKSYYPELKKKIAELEQAKEEIRNSEKNLTELFNTVGDAIIILRYDGTLLRANQAMFSMFAVDRDTYRDEPIFSYVSAKENDPPSLLERIQNVPHAIAARFECRGYQPKRDAYFDAEMTLRPFFWYEEEVVLAVVRDITQQKKQEQQRYHSQKMEAVGQLASGIAHDFNNELAGIIGAAELLKLENITSAEAQSFVSLIIKAAERAGSLTKRLLSFSRKGQNEQRSINCAKILEDTKVLLQHTVHKSISIRFTNVAQYTTIKSNNTALQNIFMNLGINASHAMPHGGTISITLKNETLDERYCRESPFALTPGLFIHIIFADTGCGIPATVQERIFEPFFTTKDPGKGTGLGLASVYDVVQKHHGAITLNSEVGTGTAFHIYLPISREQNETKTASVPDLQYDRKGTILLIDDEEVVRITTASLLKNLGYTVYSAASGEEGLSLFHRQKNTIDLVILDMMMPRMGGEETFYALRKISQKTPIIIASGFAHEDEIERLHQNGVNGFIYKPFRTSELAEILQREITISQNQQKDTDFQ